MNVSIDGIFQNGYFQERKNKKTGEISRDYILQIQQTETLEDGSMKLIPLNIPLDEEFAKNYLDKKYGDKVRATCNVYGDNFAEIKISKMKR
ncbi:hypothetical protein ACN9J6_09745 [Aliarcobacter butzleri]|uniref:hypothetical protein n=1 Tax=Aliarcobacter butzleri TaxID=28197 RepID=UPI003B2191AE